MKKDREESVAALRYRSTHTHTYMQWVTYVCLNGQYTKLYGLMWLSGGSMSWKSQVRRAKRNIIISWPFPQSWWERRSPSLSLPSPHPSLSHTLTSCPALFLSVFHFLSHAALMRKVNRAEELVPPSERRWGEEKEVPEALKHPYIKFHPPSLNICSHVCLTVGIMESLKDSHQQRLSRLSLSLSPLPPSLEQCRPLMSPMVTVSVLSLLLEKDVVTMGGQSVALMGNWVY